MPVYTRDTLKSLYREIESSTAQVFLLTGDRFLCRQAAERIEQILTRDGGTVHTIDGEEEEPSRTIGRLRSFSLLPGTQVYRVTDTRLFHSKKIAESLWKRTLKAHRENKREAAVRNLTALMLAGGLNPERIEDNPASLSAAEWKKCFDFTHPGGDLSWIGGLLEQVEPVPPAAGAETDPAAMLEEALETGLPAGTFLLLLSEEVDKRKRLYKYLKKNQIIVDLGVEKGASSRAQKAQKAVLQELVSDTLREMGKRMAGGVLEQLLERVGFHPVAVVMETEKLCLSVGERDIITLEDLNGIVGRTRQEALFELTGAIGKGQLGQALVLCSRLVDQSIHPLAVIATLRNYVRTLLLFRSLQEQPEYGFTPGMQAREFQSRCLPLLKENSSWSKELSGHPYALFMQFTTASGLPLQRLIHWLDMILAAERRLKGSPVDHLTLLHHLLVRMLVPEADEE